MEEIKLIEITIEEFKETLYNDYIDLFPRDEQRDWENIECTYENGIEKFYKIISENIVVGFMLLERINEKTLYYIDYFAIKKEFQNKGYGTKSLKVLLNTIVKENGLCIEIETPNEKNKQTVKRAKFYENLGFKKVNSEYELYNVLYTPYIYSKSNLNKDEIDKIMFEYYYTNCGKKAVEKYCKIIF